MSLTSLYNVYVKDFFFSFGITITAEFYNNLKSIKYFYMFYLLFFSRSKTSQPASTASTAARSTTTTTSNDPWSTSFSPETTTTTATAAATTAATTTYAQHQTRDRLCNRIRKLIGSGPNSDRLSVERKRSDNRRRYCLVRICRQHHLSIKANTALYNRK